MMSVGLGGSAAKGLRSARSCWPLSSAVKRGKVGRTEERKRKVTVRVTHNPRQAPCHEAPPCNYVGEVRAGSDRDPLGNRGVSPLKRVPRLSPSGSLLSVS